MVYRALRSFSGVISMTAGEERELKDQYLIDDLLKACYIQPNVESPAQRVAQKLVDNEPKAVKKEEVKKTRKGGKKKSEN